MNSTASKIVAVVAAIALVVVLFFVFSGDDSDSTTDTVATTPTTATETTGSGGSGSGDKPDPKPDEQVPTIVVEGGQPVGGLTDLTFDNGDDVRFVVASDTADEVHVHGYDISEEVAAGDKATFDFPADIDGVFEIELENSAVPIAELTVNP